MLGTLIEKDVRCLLRSRQAVLATGFFAIVLVVVTSFAFRRVGLTAEEINELSPGILWAIYLFVTVVSLEITFSYEREQRALGGVLLTQVSPTTVYLAKAMVNLVFVVSVQTLILICHGLFFGAAVFEHFFSLWLIVLVLSVGMVALGTLLAGIASSNEQKSLLFPLLLFPLSIPPLAAAVFTSNQIYQTGSVPWGNFWFQLLVVFSIIRCPFV